MKMKLVSLLFGLLCMSSSTTGQCNLPPEFWCSSQQVAAQCQVELQCEKYVTISKQVAEPVSISLYYESLCPGCIQFITSQLYPTYQKVGSILNITLVPYGNAKESKEDDKYIFQCQHGPDECVGNIIETCAMDMLGNFSEYFPYIHCIETATASGSKPADSAPKCAQSMKINYDSINKCAGDSHGNQLEHQMALKTEALNPPHQYVPWVTLNGVHTEAINQAAVTDLLALVCKTYQGPKPAACTSEQRPVSYRWY